MIVETHNRLQSPHTIEATRVLIKDDHGNPIAALVQGTAGQISIEVAGDDSDAFDAFLAHYGLTSVQVVPASAPHLPR